ncbi:acetyltransferase [Acinetobacter sp. NCu2D-2]|uniref:GNAT family N-acetyltransferase n=1 Tax=Acinetobacter sp. NCu2D-2 TaxID=1608473 RepID=UPI0007CDBEC5|nr:GNAT family N-acetyltransferase [Acinetobacter sp. NCu2D-2]ANF81838.1 acetyltransferase [Acinetobacter sp. NCu2D-2]
MYSIRPIQSKDNAQIAHVIRQVSIEFGLAAESGFAVGDSILDQLYHVYNQTCSKYWVIVNENDQVVGGGGIAPLKGDPQTLEIQKMYFLPEIRQQGFAKKILHLAFEFAQEQKIHQIYLETTKSLWQAVKLYEKLGFIHLDKPMGNTGHSQACEIWMLKSI